MTQKDTIPVLAVVGPTAAGKTSIGAALAAMYGGEVVSADSMQIYAGLDIATAKPTADEMCGVPHHLIGCVPMDASFSVADYLALAKPVIADIHHRGKLPVLVGGTGLYIASLLSNLQLSPIPQDDALRQELWCFAKAQGNLALHARLKALDPEAAAEIHPNNLVRVVRALEVCLVSGQTFSAYKAQSRSAPSPYRALQIGLTYADRQLLYHRIDCRVDEMVQRGLVEEARAVYTRTDLQTACNAIGYKELIPYFRHTMSLEACIDKIKQETRRYAKRQLTWFRKSDEIQWIILDKCDKKQEILEKCQKMIAKSGIMCYNIE